MSSGNSMEIVSTKSDFLGTVVATTSDQRHVNSKIDY